MSLICLVVVVAKEVDLVSPHTYLRFPAESCLKGVRCGLDVRSFPIGDVWSRGFPYSSQVSFTRSGCWICADTFYVALIS